ncbi:MULTISPECIES: DUF461 domain-containing protein [Streptomyces]|uniref:DUF461 domain-containing protein n=1 Tax=Streptomyces evansiae TaxID=3075535 RepID=A0ABD5E6C9_9ACTN|nr:MULTISPECIES: DUF461 domain-containing protein [unclassified Streptomyces]MDT0416974.1 DUF461 domain-containing protein [Streptomyces sp. DSM 41982]SCD52560.1 hypothetical protein GA0115246_102761 [Streptomyces sp. SolWspMP-sol7th]
MSSSLRRGALAASALAFSIATLAACGAGNNAQTLEVKPDNAATSVGDVKVQNVTVVTQPERDASGPAAILATVFNNSAKAQTLDSLAVGGEQADLKPAKGSGSLSVPAHGKVIIGGEGNASAKLPSGREALNDGDVQEVAFGFSETGTVKLKAYVLPANHYFKGWGPSETPSASASESASGSPSASSSESPESGASGEAATGSGSPDAGASSSASGDTAQ